MGLSMGHLLLVLLIVFVVFGAGKLPRVMGDIGKGIRSMREGMRSEDEARETPPPPYVPPRQVAQTLDQEVSREKDRTNS